MLPHPGPCGGFLRLAAAALGCRLPGTHVFFPPHSGSRTACRTQARAPLAALQCCSCRASVMQWRRTRTCALCASLRALKGCTFCFVLAQAFQGCRADTATHPYDTGLSRALTSQSRAPPLHARLPLPRAMPLHPAPQRSRDGCFVQLTDGDLHG